MSDWRGPYISRGEPGRGEVVGFPGGGGSWAHALDAAREAAGRTGRRMRVLRTRVGGWAYQPVPDVPIRQERAS